jgi:hypothetical protein
MSASKTMGSLMFFVFPERHPGLNWWHFGGIAFLFAIGFLTQHI